MLLLEVFKPYIDEMCNKLETKFGFTAYTQI